MDKTASPRAREEKLGKEAGSVTKKQIKDSLLKQLRDKGAELDHFKSLVDDYCWFWDMVRKMQADIRKNGMNYEAVSAAGKNYDKENPAIKNAAMYNQRCMAILRDLGLTTDTAPPPEDTEDATGL